MGVEHLKQERGLPVKYHATNNYGQYDDFFIMFEYSHWQHTSFHIQNSKRIYQFAVQHFQNGNDNGVGEQVELHGPYIRRLHIGVEDVHHFKQFKLFKMGRYLNLHE